MIIGSVYPLVSQAIGGLSFLIFGAIILVSIIYVTFCVPETKGKTIRWVFIKMSGALRSMLVLNIRKISFDFQLPKSPSHWPTQTHELEFELLLSEIQKYFIGAVETYNTEGDYVDPNSGREKLKALLSFCQD